jgi:hypothetical protein
MQDNPTPQAQWSVRNVTNALVVALLSAGVLSCQLYADRYPKETAIIALFLIVFASIMRLPISSMGGPSVLNVERAGTVTQNNPPAAEEPPPAAASAPRPPSITITGPLGGPIRTTTIDAAAPHPAPAHPPVRDARGQYAKAAPLNVVADS